MYKAIWKMYMLKLSGIWNITRLCCLVERLVQIAGLRGYLPENVCKFIYNRNYMSWCTERKIIPELFRIHRIERRKNKQDFIFRDKSSGWKLYGKMILENRDGSQKKRYFEPEESSYYQMF